LTSIFIISNCVFAAVLCICSAALPLVGTSESGMEFGSALPGTYSKDYIAPDNRSITHFLQRRMNFIRVPFRWERIQHAPLAILDPFELGRIQGTVANVTGGGGYAALDVHNYGRYNLDGKDYVIGANDSLITTGYFIDLWVKLAKVFMSNNRVIFALMNEPHDEPTMLWKNISQATINAIRATGAKNLVFVPGNSYTGAHSWTKGCYDTGGSCITNAQAFADFVDPGNNFVFEMHQYLDKDSSGTGDCYSADAGPTALADATTWLRQQKQKAFLGEFGSNATDLCASAVNNLLTFMESNADCWQGWSWWSAGPWWGSYFLSIEPNLTTGADKPQFSYLKAHLP